MRLWNLPAGLVWLRCPPCGYHLHSQGVYEIHTNERHIKCFQTHVRAADCLEMLCCDLHVHIITSKTIPACNSAPAGVKIV